MKEYLHDDGSTTYGNQNLKPKLLTHYGDSIFVTDGNGLFKGKIYANNDGQ